MAHGVGSQKRDWGSGSIYRDRSGQWWAALRVDGRRVAMRAKSEAHATRRLKDARRRVAAGQVPNENPTVAEWLTWWGDNMAPDKVAPTTARKYRGVIRNHLIPAFARLRLSDLRPEHVIALRRRMETDGPCPSNVLYVRRVLSAALRDAEALGRPTSPDVVRKAPAPKKPPARTSDRLSEDDALAVIATAAGDRYEALAVLVLMTGMRQGECLRLRWADVDLGAGVARITRAKTAAGVREVALPAPVVDALRTHRARQRRARMAAPIWDDGGWVFTNDWGGPLHERVCRRWWSALCKRAGIGHRRFHAARHTAATVMLAHGVPLEVISKVLGHADITTTARVYAEVLPSAQRAAADVMGQVLGGS